MSRSARPWLRAALLAGPAAAALLCAAHGAPPVEVREADGEQALYAWAAHLADRGKDMAPLALEALARYDRLFPEGRFLDDVHLRMARAELARGHEDEAAARFVEVIIVDAGSPAAAAAAEELDRLLERDRGLRDRSRRYREALARFRVEGAPASTRRLHYLRALLLIDDKHLTDLVLAEGGAWIETTPGAEEAGQTALDLAALARRREQPRRAVAECARVEFLRPPSPLVARALLLQGDVLEQDLHEHLEAARAYERVAREHESAPEASLAWLRKGMVERDGLKRPVIAVRDFDEVLTRDPQGPEAFLALLAKAETLRADLRDSAAAEKVYVDGAQRYPNHPRAPEALALAAEVARRDRDDPGRAAELSEEVARRYPRFEGAVEALFTAAELREGLAQRERAFALYEEVVKRWPESSQAGKARKRRIALERTPR